MLRPVLPITFLSVIIRPPSIHHLSICPSCLCLPVRLPVEWCQFRVSRMFSDGGLLVYLVCCSDADWGRGSWSDHTLAWQKLNPVCGLTELSACPSATSLCMSGGRRKLGWGVFLWRLPLFFWWCPFCSPCFQNSPESARIHLLVSLSQPAGTASLPLELELCLTASPLELCSTQQRRLIDHARSRMNALIKWIGKALDYVKQNTDWRLATLTAYFPQFLRWQLSSF